jgi:hypothetical protein
MIFQGIKDMNTHDRLREDLLSGERQWREVKSETYRKMLKCGKPIRASDSSFMSCEPAISATDRTKFHFTGVTKGFGCYAALCSTGEWDTHIIGWGKPFPKETGKKFD